MGIADRKAPALREPDVGLPLGFALGRRGVTLFADANIKYQGIDRLPHPPMLDATHGLGATQLALWQRLQEIEFDSLLCGDMQQICDLRERFFEIGVEFDVIFAELIDETAVETRKDVPMTWRSAIRHAREAAHRLERQGVRRPAAAEFLGFDVSHPLPTFHSVIAQPMLDGADLYLNDSGLFDDPDRAARAATAANALRYGTQPFCVIGVWNVQRERT